jgi:hypothetical protein
VVSHVAAIKTSDFVDVDLVEAVSIADYIGFYCVARRTLLSYDASVAMKRRSITSLSFQLIGMVAMRLVGVSEGQIP